MDERDWEILEVLYEQKNITKTAQILFMTQPALTKRLMQIEEAFQVKIVNRGIRGVHFTPHGEYLARKAIVFRSLLRETREDLANMSDDVIGTLRIGVSNFFGKYKLPELLQRFNEQYPKVTFQIETGLSKEIYALTHHGNVHVGFVRGDYSWPEQKHLMFEEPIVVANRTGIDMTFLPSMPRVDYDTDHLFKSLIDHWWNENYTKPANVIMKVDRGDTCLEMVLRGLGYAIVPEMLLRDAPELHHVPLLQQDGSPVIRQTWMFYRENALEQNAVRAFVEFIKDPST